MSDCLIYRYNQNTIEKFSLIDKENHFVQLSLKIKAQLLLCFQAVLI